MLNTLIVDRETEVARTDNSILTLINNYLEDMTIPNARKVLNHAKNNPTCLIGLNRTEVSIYMAIVANLGEEIK